MKSIIKENKEEEAVDFNKKKIGKPDPKTVVDELKSNDEAEKLPPTKKYFSNQ